MILAMSVISAVLLPVVGLLQSLITIEILLILVRVILAYTTISRWHPVVQAIYSVTEPPLDLARRLPHILGQFDFSPFIATIGLYLVGQIIGNLTVVLLH